MTAIFNATGILHRGDCLDVLAAMDENSVDSIVTDPPYHLASIVARFGAEDAAAPKGAGAYQRGTKGFMGKTWDGGDIAFRASTWAAMLRVLKPGGYLVAFAAPKNSHRMVCAIEDAGFEICDSLQWMFGTGFPKSQNVALFIDKALGVASDVVGQETITNDMRGGGLLDVAHGERPAYERDVKVPTSPEAQAWIGYGTALKPAFEPICLAQKPMTERTIALNILRWGVGALNIDGCRVEAEERPHIERRNDKSLDAHRNTYGSGINGSRNVGTFDKGRWPANVLHDGSAEVVEAFPTVGSSHPPDNEGTAIARTVLGPDRAPRAFHPGFADSGSAARFFYSAKADTEDRLGSKHPTKKPLDLMRWLVRLVTPAGGLALDPFAGTGTTGEAAFREGLRCALIEREEEYQRDIVRRSDAALTAGPMTRKGMAYEHRQKPADELPLFGNRDDDGTNTRPDDGREAYVAPWDAGAA